MAAVKPGTKRRKNRKPIKDDLANRNLGKGFYFI